MGGRRSGALSRAVALRVDRNYVNLSDAEETRARCMGSADVWGQVLKLAFAVLLKREISGNPQSKDLALITQSRLLVPRRHVHQLAAGEP